MKKIFIVLIMIIVLLACTKEEINQDISVIGFVKLYYTDAYSEIYERDGVKVEIKGTSLTAYTNKIGKFQFNSLQQGTLYTFKFSKEGFSNDSITTQFVGYQKPGLVEAYLHKKY